MSPVISRARKKAEEVSSSQVRDSAQDWTLEPGSSLKARSQEALQIMSRANSTCICTEHEYKKAGSGAREGGPRPAKAAAKPGKSGHRQNLRAKISPPQRVLEYGNRQLHKKVTH